MGTIYNQSSAWYAEVVLYFSIFLSTTFLFLCKYIRQSGPSVFYLIDVTLLCAQRCFLILRTKPWPCFHCACTFICDLRQLFYNTSNDHWRPTCEIATDVIPFLIFLENENILEILGEFSEYFCFCHEISAYLLSSWDSTKVKIYAHRRHLWSAVNLKAKGWIPPEPVIFFIMFNFSECWNINYFLKAVSVGNETLVRLSGACRLLYRVYVVRGNGNIEIMEKSGNNFFKLLRIAQGKVYEIHFHPIWDTCT